MSGNGDGAEGNEDSNSIPWIWKLYFLSEDQKKQVLAVWKSNHRSMRIFLIGSLLLLVAATPRNPDQLSISNRIQSFSGVTDPQTAHLWAQNGFHSDSNGASCFHCGAHTNQLTQDPVQLHSNLSPDCHLVRLLRLLTAFVRGVVGDAGIATEVVKSERLLKGLSAALNDPITRFVESFGFSTEEVALAVAKHSISTGGHEGMRPGDLIKLLEFLSDSTAAGMIVILLMKQISIGCDLLSMDGTAKRTTNNIDEGPTTTQLNPIRHGEATTNQRAQDQTLVTKLKDDGSPLCRLCRRHQISVVLLPCSHLMFCRICVQVASLCPFCGSTIVAILTAFLC